MDAFYDIKFASVWPRSLVTEQPYWFEQASVSTTY